MKRGWFLIAAVFWAVPAVVAVSPVGAQTPPTTRVDSEARSLFEAGRSAFADARYEDALDAFRRSYALSQRPELLFNIGQCEDRLRHDAEAVAAFEAFIEALPDAAQRPEIEARLAILRASIARAEAAAAQAETVTVPVSEPEPEAEIVVAPVVASEPDPAPWIVLGTGGAVAIVGAILLGVGYANIATVENASGVPFSSVSGAYHDAPILTGAGWAALGVGVAVAGVGLVWGLTSGSGSSEQHARVRVGPTDIAVSGSF